MFFRAIFPFFVASFFSVACSYAVPSTDSYVFNELGFLTQEEGTESYKPTLITSSNDDETTIIGFSIKYRGSKHSFEVKNEEVIIFGGERGLLRLEDINFDGYPDVGFQTAFSVANQYMDYWIFEPNTNSFLFMGNYPLLTPDLKNNSLSAVVKADAETYSRICYGWSSGRLKPIEICEN